MTGLTTEIESIEEGLRKLHVFCLTTYGKPPTHFIVGEREYLRLKWEFSEKLPYEDVPVDISQYWGIPIVISMKAGLDIGLPESIAA